MGEKLYCVAGVLQCVVAVCCSMLQYVAVCCTVLQCVSSWAESCKVLQRCCRGVAEVLQCVAVCCSVLAHGRKAVSCCRCVAACCNVLNRAAARCSVLQYVAACCSVLQCVEMYCSVQIIGGKLSCCNLLQRDVRCSVLQFVHLIVKRLQISTVQLLFSYCGVATVSRIDKMTGLF